MEQNNLAGIRQYIGQNRERFYEELFSLLRIPSVSAQKEHHPDMLACAERMAELLRDATKPEYILPTETPWYSDRKYWTRP